MASLLLPGSAVGASAGVAQNDRARQPQAAQTLRSGFKGRRSGKLSASAPATCTDRKQRMLSVTNSTSELVKVAETSTVPVRTASFPFVSLSLPLPVPLQSVRPSVAFVFERASTFSGTCQSPSP